VETATGEENAGASERSRYEDARDAPQGDEAVAGENGYRGVRGRSVRRFVMRCSVPCMPAMSDAALKSLGTFFIWRFAISGGKKAQGHAEQSQRAGLTAPKAPTGK